MLTIELQPGDAANLQLQLPVSGLNDLIASASNTIVNVNVGYAGYQLPLNTISPSKLVSSLGGSADDATLTIQITQVTGSQAASVQTAIQNAGYAPVGTSIAFTVTASSVSNGKSIEVTDFGGAYVPRTIQLAQAQGAETSNLIVVRIEADGKVTVIPATFAQGNATILSPSNSIYMVVQSKAKTFSDIQQSWAKANIELLAKKQIMLGVSEDKFSPNAPVTRAEFAALLARSLALTPAAGGTAFTDVPAGKWYADSVNAAFAAGIIKGFSATAFGPEQAITREQLALMLVQAAATAGKPLGASAAATAFKDQASISDWALDAVKSVQSAGVVLGNTDGTFAPAAQVTRAQAAAMLDRLLHKIGFMN